MSKTGLPQGVPTDEDGVAWGTPTNPFAISATLVATTFLSVGANGAPIPADTNQVGGEDASGNLQPVQVLPTAPAGTERGLITRNIPSGTQSVTGTGTAGAPVAGVMSVQGVPGGTAIPVSGTFSDPAVGLNGAAAPTSSNQVGGFDGGGLLRATQVLAAAPAGTEQALVTRNIPSGTQAVSAPGGAALALDATLTSGAAKAMVTGTGTAGAPAAGVVTVQGIASGTVIPVSGDSSDNSANSTAKVPTIPARSNAAAPTWTEGNQVPLSVDLAGALRTSTTFSGTATVAGNKTNNAAAPGATNVGSLVALANAAAPSWTEGNQVLASVDLSGSQRTRGVLTNNNAAPGATNIGVLPALANKEQPTNTEGNQVLNSVDLSGNQRIRGPSIATYSLATARFTPAATATDVFILNGSATKTVKVTRIILSGNRTADANEINYNIVKRSTANTGGTSATATNVPLDSNSAAATAVGKSYTANPAALGTAVGTVDNRAVTMPQSNTPLQPAYVCLWEFGSLFESPIVLRGTAEGVAINLEGAALAAGATDFQVTVYWTEE